MIICKHIAEIIWQLIVHIFITKLKALNLEYILYFQQMQLFEKRLRVYIIQAVFHNPKYTFLQFWYAIPCKAPVCNSELKVQKDQRVIN